MLLIHHLLSLSLSLHPQSMKSMALFVTAMAVLFGSSPGTGTETTTAGLSAIDPAVGPTAEPTYNPSASPTSNDFIVGDSEMTWGEAEDWCLKHHGRHLASIHNDSQNDAASSVCDGECWIGATCKDGTITVTAPWDDHGDCFEWSDGTSWDYMMWNVGEPNDGDSDEDCVNQGDDGLWNDDSCDATYRPLCGNNGSHSVFLHILCPPKNVYFVHGHIGLHTL